MLKSDDVVIPTTLRLQRRHVHWLRRKAVEDAERHGAGRPDVSRAAREVIDLAMTNHQRRDRA
jgi:hypothetical protein